MFQFTVSEQAFYSTLAHTGLLSRGNRPGKLSKPFLTEVFLVFHVFCSIFRGEGLRQPAHPLPALPPR